jgi:hypothetical protein
VPVVVNRIRIVVYEVVTARDFAARAEAATEVWVCVINTGVDDSDGHPGSIQA